MKNRVILTIGVVASSIAAAGCDGAIRVRGRVVDAAGEPVSTARIYLSPARDGRRFDDSVTHEGCFTIRRVVAPGRYNYTVRITAPGFKPVQDLLPTNEDNRAIIVLQPMTESSQSSFAKAEGKWPESPLAASCSDGFTAVALVPTVGIVLTPRTVQGRYRHPGQGFSVSVPEGTTGLLESDPAVERGIRIALPSGGSIFARGEPNTLEWPTPTDGIRSEVAGLTECSSSPIRSTARLGKLVGAESRLSCGDRVRRLLLAFRPGGGPIYWLRLESASKHEAEDTRFFDRVASSFQTIRWE